MICPRSRIGARRWDLQSTGGACPWSHRRELDLRISTPQGQANRERTSAPREGLLNRCEPKPGHAGHAGHESTSRVAVGAYQNPSRRETRREPTVLEAMTDIAKSATRRER